MKTKLYLAILTIVSLIGCTQVYKMGNTKEANQRATLARVNDIYLYQEDINTLVPKDKVGRDSINIATKYIDSWVKKQLIIARASKELDFDGTNIERKILDYRHALMAHEFESHYINKHLIKDISESEIRQYYANKSENFMLRQNILKCLFAKVPVEAPQIVAFRTLIQSYPDTNMEEINSYCYRFASTSSLDKDRWLSFDAIITNTPLAEQQEKTILLKNNSFVEASDEKFYYFFRILDYKISNQLAPLEYIQDDIESILINKKKIELRKKLEEEVYKVAKENNEFEIY